MHRSLTTYRLRSPLLLFVYDNIKFYNVRGRRVNLTEASPCRFCTERSLYFVNVLRLNVLRLSCTTSCLRALRRLVVTTLYGLYSLVAPLLWVIHVIDQSLPRDRTVNLLTWNRKSIYIFFY